MSVEKIPPRAVVATIEHAGLVHEACISLFHLTPTGIVHMLETGMRGDVGPDAVRHVTWRGNRRDIQQKLEPAMVDLCRHVGLVNPTREDLFMLRSLCVAAQSMVDEAWAATAAIIEQRLRAQRESASKEDGDRDLDRRVGPAAGPQAPALRLVEAGTHPCCSASPAGG